MLYRKIEHLITAHLQSDSKQILLIDGARQVGKTYIIRHAGQKLFENFIEINLIEDFLGDKLFSGIKNTEDFYLQLSMVAGDKMKEKKNTLVFLDEIQAYPHLLTLLKFLSQDAKFTYIASGSLLGGALSQTTSIPMGSIRKERMFPLDFEEFLWAKGYDDGLIADLLDHMRTLTPFSELELSVCNSLFLDFCILGGMPAVVREYVEQGTFEGSLDIQRQLIADYREDIRKYAEGLDQGRILNVFDQRPPQLAKENKKFQRSKVASGARFKDYRGCIEWLSDAGMVNIC